MVERIDPHPIHPTYKAKFKSGTAQTVIRDILKQRLEDEMYNQDAAPTLTRELADQIKNELRKMGLARYKFLVQVVIGEQRGAGVRMATRCFWDPQSDGFATDTFINDTLFCTATAWALYLY